MRRILLLVCVVSGLVLAGCSSDTASDTPTGSDSSPATGPASSTAPTSTDSSTTKTDTPATTEVPTTQPAPTTTSPPSTVPLESLELQLEPIAQLDRPVAFAQRPGTTDLFVAEKGGQVQNISTEAEVLDVSAEVSSGNEQGLLGMAFSPDGAQLFINFTDRSGNTIVRWYGMDGATVDATSAVDIIEVDQERANHNGGNLAFGPDGYLYIGLGDGGGGGDPGSNGQNPRTLLGSMLRIEPTDDGYSIPADNPFADGADGAPEVFMWGLRNPWRYSFDAANGDLWIGDVGQDRFEEVDVVRAGAQSGANLGWNQLEGFEPYRDGFAPVDSTPPIAAYAQAGGRCSVTGGAVYRGSEVPSLVGTYVFGDYCTGEILGLDAEGDGTIVPLLIDRVDQLASFGVDAAGELYPVSLGGTVYRVIG